METSQLLDLIPLYVTGKVTEEQRSAIEGALPLSNELQAELAFWQSAQWAATASSASLHPESEQIVAYARGMPADATERIRVESHLQECTSCREDFDIVKEAFAATDRTGAPQVNFSWLLRFAGAMLKPAYSIPALAVLVVCVLLLKDQFTEPPGHPIDFVLAYQSHERSVDSSAMPVLQIGKDVSNVQLSVHIPHAIVQPEQYSLTLFSPGSRESSVLEEVTWSQGTSDFDTARASIPTSSLSGAGTHTLVASIIYAGTSRAFEYSYRFRVAVTN